MRTAQAVAMPVDRLIFEFTENEEMGSPEHVTGIIDTYKQIGFSVAIDDFGAGHSGLDMFARFVPDEIKLDMDLIRDIDTNARRRAIVRSMVGMCRELDTLLIAEGIETAAEAAVLNDLGVRYHGATGMPGPNSNACRRFGRRHWPAEQDGWRRPRHHPVSLNRRRLAPDRRDSRARHRAT